LGASLELVTYCRQRQKNRSDALATITETLNEIQTNQRRELLKEERITINKLHAMERSPSLANSKRNLSSILAMTVLKYFKNADVEESDVTPDDFMQFKKESIENIGDDPQNWLRVLGKGVLVCTREQSITGNFQDDKFIEQLCERAQGGTAKRALTLHHPSCIIAAVRGEVNGTKFFKLYSFILMDEKICVGTCTTCDSKGSLAIQLRFHFNSCLTQKQKKSINVAVGYDDLSPLSKSSDPRTVQVHAYDEALPPHEDYDYDDDDDKELKDDSHSAPHENGDLSSNASQASEHLAEATSDSTLRGPRPYTYPILGTRRAFANAEYSEMSIAPTYTQDLEDPEKERINLVREKGQNILSGVVMYSPAYKGMTLKQTRKPMEKKANGLSFLLKEILFATDEIPPEAVRELERTLVRLSEMFSSVIDTLGSRHQGQLPVRFEANFPLTIESLDKISKAKIDQVFNIHQIALCLRSSKISSIGELSGNVNKRYMVPLRKMLTRAMDVINALEKEEMASFEKQFYGLYQGNVATAILECADIVKAFLQFGHCLKSSVIYSNRKVHSHEATIWQALLMHREQISRSVSLETGLQYGLAVHALPGPVLDIATGKVNGFSLREVERLKPKMDHGDLYLYSVTRLNKALATINKTRSTGVIDHQAVIESPSLSSTDIEAFLAEATKILYDLHIREHFRWVQSRLVTKKIILAPGKKAPPVPTSKDDIMQWAEATNNMVAFVKNFRTSAKKPPGKGVQANSVTAICTFMFGPGTRENLGSGWNRSPSRFLYQKVLWHVEKFRGWYPERQDLSTLNPFNQTAFETRLAEFVNTKGWLWYTQRSAQRRFVGAAVPVQLKLVVPKDPSLPSKSKKRSTFKEPKDQWDDFFFTLYATENENEVSYPIMDVFSYREEVNGWIEFIKEEKRKPSPRESHSYSQRKVNALFGEYWGNTGTPFRRPAQWINRYKNQKRNGINVQRVFQDCNSIGEIDNLKCKQSKWKKLWKTVFQPLNDEGREKFEQLQMAIGKDGKIDFTHLNAWWNDEEFVWPKLESRDDATAEQHEEKSWSNQVEEVWSTAKVNSIMADKISWTRKRWLEILTDCTTTQNKQETKERFVEQVQKDLGEYVLPKKLMEKPWKSDTDLGTHFFSNPIE
jgi:hypothetical protein